MTRTVATVLAALMVAGCAMAPRLTPVPDPASAVAGIRAPFTRLAEQGMRRVFHSHDRDGDGALSVDESGLPLELFTRLDTDHDRRLGDGEMVRSELASGFAPAMAAFGKEVFRRADRDGNGLVSEAEVALLPELAVLTAEKRWGRSLRAEGWDPAAFDQELARVLGNLPDPTVAGGLAKGRTPVLVVQGYLEPSYYFMYGIYDHLKKAGHPVYGINLFPNLSAADVQARKVEAKIQSILKETGASRINLVCHSFGGIISRYIIQKRGGSQYVDRYVSIATPHFGTYWCLLPGLGGACSDMRVGSAFLADLNRQTTVPPVRYASIYTETDEITLPPKNCILPGAHNYPPVAGTDHLLILWSPTTYRYVDECLR